MTSYWTTEDIRDAMNQAGSHWWDRDNMKFFGTRVGGKIYAGPGGMYFVTSEKPPYAARTYNVRKFNPETKEIRTVGESCLSLTRAKAHTLARLAAEGSAQWESTAERLSIPTASHARGKAS